MKSQEVYASLLAISKDHERKEVALRIIRTTLEFHIAGEEVDIKGLIELITKTLE